MQLLLICLLVPTIYSTKDDLLGTISIIVGAMIIIECCFVLCLIYYACALCWNREIPPWLLRILRILSVHDFFDDQDPQATEEALYSIRREQNEHLSPTIINIENIQSILIDKDTQSILINDNDVPHNIECIICFEHKKTHLVPGCGHLVACAICAKKLEEFNKKCTICRNPFTKLQKIYF